ncbi:hypothetical protein V1509DRAFT_219660 [Lipomyces kononenkoae]
MPRSASLAFRSLFRKSSREPHDTFYSFDDQDDDTITSRELEDAQLRMHRRGSIPAQFYIDDQSASSVALDNYEYILISPPDSDKPRWRTLGSIRGSFRRKRSSSQQEPKYESGEDIKEDWDISNSYAEVSYVTSENKGNKLLDDSDNTTTKRLTNGKSSSSRWGTLMKKMSIRKKGDKLKPLVVDFNPVNESSPVYANDSRYYTVTVPISPYTERSVRSVRSSSFSDKYTDASSSLSLRFKSQSPQPRLRKRSNRFGKWDTSHSRSWTLGTFRYLEADPYNNRVKQYLDAYRNLSRQQRHPRYEQLLDSARLINARAAIFQCLGME